MTTTARDLIEGRPVLVVIDIQGGAVAGSSTESHQAALRPMEYVQAGASRSSREVMAAFEGYSA